MTDPKFSELCKFIEETMTRLKIPGAAIGILQDGETLSAGLGITHIEHPLEITADTLMQIGSVTKTFVGTATMMLVEEGKLELDTPIHEIMPDFALSDEETAKEVTMRHLLTHVGGWEGDYFDDFGDGDNALAQYIKAVQTMPQVTPLGKYWSYNNAAFSIAGRVIEVVSGQVFEDFIQERIFTPLGMDKSFFFERDVMLHRFAVGHHITPDGAQVASPWPIARAANSAGRISSTVNDMLKYAQFHLSGGLASDGSRLLSEALVAEMQETQVQVGGILERMGITWWLDNLDGVELVHHGGATNGQLAMLVFIPEKSFAYVLLTNGADMGRELINGTKAWIISEYAGANFPESKPMDKSKESLTEYTGIYTSRMSDIMIAQDENNLVFQIKQKGGFPLPDSPPPPHQPPPLNVVFYEDDNVFVRDEGAMKNAKAQFIRDDKGDLIGVRMSARIHKRVM